MNTTLLTQAGPAKASVSPVQTQLLQRQCACGGSAGMGGDCENCDQQKLARQRSTAGEHETPNRAAVPPVVHDVLRSAGRPLDRETRAFMEPRFGHDFSRVRVHTDAQAAESARAVNALAYTMGQDIAFGAGRYAPDTTAGKKLLAHELTHTLQQSHAGERGPMLASSLQVSRPDDPHEREADMIAARVVGGSSDAFGASAVDGIATAPTSLIQRQSEGEEEAPAPAAETAAAVDEPAAEDPGTEGEAQDVAPGELTGGGCPVQRRAVRTGTFTNFGSSPFNVNRGCTRVAIQLTAQWLAVACCNPGPTYRVEVTGPTPHNANLRAGIVGLQSCNPTRPPQTDTTSFTARPGAYTLKMHSIGDDSCARLNISGGHVRVS